jgi:type II secretion system protein J
MRSSSSRGPGRSSHPEVGSAGQRLGYRLARGAVEVLYWPWLDNAAGTEPMAYALEGDIAAFRIEYLDRTGAWRDHWPFAGGRRCPRRSRRLTLATGETVERWLALQ